MEEEPGACGEPPENLGFNVWRSADEGASWERLAQSAEMQNAHVTDIISMDGVLVAVGNVLDPQARELDSSAVWTSLGWHRLANDRHPAKAVPSQPGQQRERNCCRRKLWQRTPHVLGGRRQQLAPSLSGG